VNLDFDTDRWARVRDAYRRWWAGELGRPLINLTLRGRDPGRPEPRVPSHEFTSLYDLDVPAEAIVDGWLYDLECRRYVGDAFPRSGRTSGPASSPPCWGSRCIMERVRFGSLQREFPS